MGAKGGLGLGALCLRRGTAGAYIWHFDGAGGYGMDSKAHGALRNGKTKEAAFLLAVYNSMGENYLVPCWLVRAGLSYPPLLEEASAIINFLCVSCTSSCLVVCLSLFFTGLNSEGKGRISTGAKAGRPCEHHEMARGKEGISLRRREEEQGMGMEMETGDGDGDGKPAARCRSFRVRHQRGVMEGV